MEMKKAIANAQLSSRLESLTEERAREVLRQRIAAADSAEAALRLAMARAEAVAEKEGGRVVVVDPAHGAAVLEHELDSGDLCWRMVPITRHLPPRRQGENREQYRRRVFG